MNIVIPCAGKGSRFSKCGYSTPKPLLLLNGKPLILHVIDNLYMPDSIFHFILQEEHCKMFKLDTIIKKYLGEKNCNIIKINYITEGPLSSVLLFENIIVNKNIPIIIANCDQVLKWDFTKFINECKNLSCFGVVSTFKSDSTKYSYVRADSSNKVIDIQEKKVISNNASTGIYYFYETQSFLNIASKVIDEKIKFNNEFYISCVYYKSLQEGKDVYHIPCDKYYDMGTPDSFEKNIKKID